MIDTVMVVWTSGIWKRLLCATITFLLLFACVGILSFLVTTGGKWSSLAATITSTQPSSSTQSSLFTQPDTATQAGASTAIALAQPAPTARPKSRLIPSLSFCKIPSGWKQRPSVRAQPDTSALTIARQHIRVPRVSQRHRMLDYKTQQTTPCKICPKAKLN